MQSTLLLDSTSLLSRLAEARAAEHAGEYDAAARMLSCYWKGLGARPAVAGFADEAQAEALLRAGALTGYLGSAAQTPGAQEVALDLLTEGHTIFTRLRLPERVAEVRIELSTCYLRKGAFDAARAMLDSAVELLGDGDKYLRALAALRRAIVEISDEKYDAAFEVITHAGGLVNECGSDALRGRYHNEYGGLLFFLSESGGTKRFNEALGELLAARHWFGRAGHVRYCASAESNIALAFIRLGRLCQARRYINSARRLALCVNDQRVLAGIDDTNSQLLDEQDRLVEAEAVSRARLEALADTDHGALYAENLTTHAAILAKLGRAAEAEAQFSRAVSVAESVGDSSGAARAAALREEELRPDKVLPFRRPKACSALTFKWRLADGSLRGIGIRRNALVRFVVTGRARDGDLVAALTPAGRFIVMLYFEGSGRVRLEGAHPRCPVRRYKREEVQVLGVAVLG